MAIAVVEAEEQDEVVVHHEEERGEGAVEHPEVVEAEQEEAQRP